MRAPIPIPALLLLAACSDGGSAGPATTVEEAGLRRPDDRVQPGHGDALAAALLTAGGGNVAWTGRPGAAVGDPALAARLRFHAREHLRSAALGSGAGARLAGSARIRRLAAAGDAPVDRNGNGSNLDETAGRELERLAQWARTVPLEGTAPIVFPWAEAEATLVVPPGAAGDYAAMRTGARAGVVDMEQVGEALRARAVLAAALLHDGPRLQTGAQRLLAFHYVEQALALEETLIRRLFHDGSALVGIADPRQHDPTSEPRWLPARFRVVEDPALPGVPGTYRVEDRASSLTALAAVLAGSAELAWMSDPVNPDPHLPLVFHGRPFAPPQGSNTGPPPLSFTADVQPLLLNRCATCHTASPPISGFSVLTYDDVVRGGVHSATHPGVVPGDHRASHLWQVLVGQSTVVPLMPFGGPPLMPSQIDRIARWIDEGARKDPPPTVAPPRAGRELAAVLVRQLLAFHAGSSGALHHRFEGDEVSGVATARATGAALRSLATVAAALPDLTEARDLLARAGRFAARRQVDGAGFAADFEIAVGNAPRAGDLRSQAELAAGLAAAGRVLGDGELARAGRRLRATLLDAFRSRPDLFDQAPGAGGSHLGPAALVAVLRALHEGAADGDAAAADAREALLARVLVRLVPSEWDGDGEVLGDGVADSDGDGIPEPAAGGGHGLLPVLGTALRHGRASELPVDDRITWSRHVQPLLRSKCAECHLDGARRGEYRLDSPALAARPGQSGGVVPLIVPGSPEASLLYRKVAERNPPVGAQMPLARPPLGSHGVELLRQWILQGVSRR